MLFRSLPPPASRTVYALTEDGRAVRPVLAALFRFGERYLDDPAADAPVRPQMAVHGLLASRLDERAAEQEDLVVRFDLDGTELGLAIIDGQVRRPPVTAPADVTVQGSADSVRPELASVSAATLPMLGVRPLLGRWWAPEDDVPGRDNIIVLSYGAWQRYFGGDQTWSYRSLRRCGQRLRYFS